MLKITVDDRSVQYQLGVLERKLGNLQPVFDDIGALIESRVNLRFDTKTDPDGKAWKPWAPSTASQRAAEKRGTLLDYTGRMRDSLSYTATDKKVEIGFGVEYAINHEFGTKTIPARRMLLGSSGGLGQSDEDDVLRLIGRYFE